MSGKRIVLIDHHVIAQFYAEKTGWWTCSRANKNDEGDFAVWPETVTGLRAARRLVGDACLVITGKRPVQRGDDWYTGDLDTKAKTYNEALRALAREVQG